MEVQNLRVAVKRYYRFQNCTKNEPLYQVLSYVKTLVAIAAEGYQARNDPTKAQEVIEKYTKIAFVRDEWFPMETLDTVISVIKDAVIYFESYPQGQTYVEKAFEGVRREQAKFLRDVIEQLLEYLRTAVDATEREVA